MNTFIQYIKEGKLTRVNAMVEATLRTKTLAVLADEKMRVAAGILDEEEHIYDKIQNHLKNPDHVVAVRTHLKHTNYLPKHASYFEKPKKEGDSGVYVKRGKSRDYVFPQYVHFGRKQKAGE